MAINGTFIDHYSEVYRKTLLMAKQSSGGVIRQLAMEEIMDGSKNYFDKLGTFDAEDVDGRGEDKTFIDPSFERRMIIPKAFDANVLTDELDIIKYAHNPNGNISQALVKAIKRKEDALLLDSLKGAANVIENDTLGTKSLATGVVVNDHEYDSGTGDVSLTVSKLKKALSILIGAEALDSGVEVFCLGPIAQLMNLTVDSQFSSKDFRDKTILEGPGIVQSLNGFLGITFVALPESLKSRVIDGNSDETVYLFTRSALKVGIFKPLQVSIDKQTQKRLNPYSLSSWEVIGAARMYEEEVVKIACDPISL